jgi:hypothetical protein
MENSDIVEVFVQSRRLHGVARPVCKRSGLRTLIRDVLKRPLRSS